MPSINTKYDFLFISEDGTVKGWWQKGKFVAATKKTCAALLYRLCIEDSLVWTIMTEDEYAQSQESQDGAD